jgi:hypothetical protein
MANLVLRRLTWLGPFTVIVSVAAVLATRFIAVTLLRPDPGFMPLTLTPVIFDTVLFVTLAVLVFRRVAVRGSLPPALLAIAGARILTLDPIPAYRAIAGRVLLVSFLLVSFLPDIAIAVSGRASWSDAVALATLHVAAWAVFVPMLTRLTIPRPPAILPGNV